MRSTVVSVMILGVVFGLSACGGGGDDRWERSRTAFCNQQWHGTQEVLSFIGAAATELDRATERADAPAPRELACARVELQLAQARAYLRGFHQSAHILVRGRAENSDPSTTGIVLDPPWKPLDSRVRDIVKACARSAFDDARTRLATVRADVTEVLAQQSNACRGIGWQTPAGLP